MRIWVDMTGPAHVLVLRPIIERLRERGHEVEVTSREYTQTQQLLALHGIESTAIGRHGGASRVSKGIQLASRSRHMRRFGRGRSFDLALGHGSNDLAIAARSLGIPAANMHDYEFAVTQHQVGCRLARRVIFPDTVPADRLRRFGVTDEKLVQYPGLKEEYYLHDFKADESVFDGLGIDRERVVLIVRPPPDVSLYHRRSNPLFPEVLSHVGTRDDAVAIVLPRTEAQREYLQGLDLPSLVVPDHALEAQSLIALADLVVSAGGTMNREAAALGVPVYTTYGGALGGVDDALIRSGRLRPLTDARALELRKREPVAPPSLRDPQLLVDVVLGTLDGDTAGLEPAGGPRAITQPAPAEAEAGSGASLAERYRQIAVEHEPRRVDTALRGLDLILAGATLLLFSPIVLLIALLILMTSGRPILYRGDRVGRNGELFTMYKFRTLAPDAESRLGPYLGEDLVERTESEVTRLGRVLRVMHLDELPQLWNVVTGDMSVVGPRPIRPAFFELLCEQIPQYWQRLVVRPGVTGFAQTRITREALWEFKVAHDLEYIADRSIGLYFRVLAATVWRVVYRTLVGIRRRIARLFGRDP
ncbi:MAG: sugar transferase [Solirubrobacterales bacterium]